MKQKKLIKFILLALFIAAIFLVFKFKYIDINHIKSLILSLGIFGPILAVLLIAIETTSMIISDIFTVFACCAIYGWKSATIIAVTGSLIGSTISFFIARKLGRDFVVKLSNKKIINKLDSFFIKYGSYSILLARLIPFIPFDITSYLAGVTSISYLNFIIATAIGELPMTIFYTYLGTIASKNTHIFLIIFSSMIIGTFIIFIINKIFKIFKSCG